MATIDNTSFPFVSPDDVPPTRGNSIGINSSPIQMPGKSTQRQYGVPTITSGPMAGMSNVPAFDAEPNGANALTKKWG